VNCRAKKRNTNNFESHTQRGYPRRPSETQRRSYKMFLTLRKERDGSVSFGNDDSTKIIRKGIVRIGNKNTKEKNILLVEDMKHNLLSVSQMCDQGHKVNFDSQKCEIRKQG
jgi:hypothetical protein